MIKKIMVEQIEKMLVDEYGCEMVKILEDDENNNDILILGYLSYIQGEYYGQWDYCYSLEFNENGNLIYLHEREKEGF